MIVCSTRLDLTQQIFFVHISSFWNVGTRSTSTAEQRWLRITDSDTGVHILVRCISATWCKHLGIQQCSAESHHYFICLTICRPACMFKTAMYSLYRNITKNSLEILMVHCCPGMQQYRLWNNLAKDLHNTSLSMDTFGKHLKLLLFSASWGCSAFVTVRFLCAVYKCS